VTVQTVINNAHRASATRSKSGIPLQVS